MEANTMISGVDHLSFTVSDLQRSVHFYRDLLGFQLEFETEAGGPVVEAVTGIPGAQLKMAFFELEGFALELIQYLSPVGEILDLRTNNVGCAHLAFYVEDIEKVYVSLSSGNVRFKSKPVEIKEGPLAGRKVVYLSDPDGIILELVQRR